LDQNEERKRDTEGRKDSCFKKGLRKKELPYLKTTWKRVVRKGGKKRLKVSCGERGEAGNLSKRKEQTCEIPLSLGKSGDFSGSKIQEIEKMSSSPCTDHIT